MAKLILIVLFLVYWGGVWKFWKGFRQTSFNGSVPNRMMLSVLWPVLVITNKSYRKNFQKALKGR